jgi:hypothetical protein
MEGGVAMTNTHVTLTGKRLTTPRAAAMAGILFSILFTLSLVLIHISLPTGLADSSGWQDVGSGRVRLALGLLPFAGIAFLWFMGVIRDRLGAFEDQFFSTVFFGSGLLFLAMVFAAAAVAGGLVTSYLASPSEFTTSEVYQFGRLVMSQFFTIYALRMAGVFIISLGTIWFRTGLMPRWLSFITYLFALVLLLTSTLSLWMVLVFPIWVIIISVYILILNLKAHKPGTTDGMTVHLEAEG